MMPQSKKFSRSVSQQMIVQDGEMSRRTMNNFSQQSNNSKHRLVLPTVEDRVMKMGDFAQKVEQVTTRASGISLADHENLVEACRGVTSTIRDVTSQEIHSNKTNRTNSELMIQNARLRKVNEKLKMMYQASVHENADLMEKIKNLEGQLFSQQQKSLLDRKQVEDLNKQAAKQERRLQLSLETNLYAHRDSLKNTLSELLAENENQKKVVLNQSKEIERLQHYLNLANDKVQRLNRKINNINHIHAESEVEVNEKSRSLTFTEIPQTFDFRYQFLSPEFKAFFSQLNEHSAEEFYQQFSFNDPELKRQHITWLYNQSLNLAEFQDKQNAFFHKLGDIHKIRTTQALIHYVRSFQELFNVSEINLWLRDNVRLQLRFVRQLDQSRPLILVTKGSAPCSSGLFRECLDSMQAQNRLAMQNFVVYQDDQGKDVHQNRTYLIPLKTATLKPGGLLEFTKLSDRFSNINSDLQYFGSVLATYCTLQLDLIEEIDVLEYQARYRELFVEEFIGLCRATNRLGLVRQVQEMQQRVFSLSTCEIIFADYNGNQVQLSKYLPNDKLKTFEGYLGVAGQTILSKHPAFFKSIMANTHFNDQVDFSSLLPIYFYPIIKKRGEAAKSDFHDRDRVVAVLQMSVSNRHLRKHKFKDSNAYLNTAECEVKFFCELVSAAYNLLPHL